MNNGYIKKIKTMAANTANGTNSCITRAVELEGSKMKQTQALEALKAYQLTLAFNFKGNKSGLDKRLQTYLQLVSPAEDFNKSEWKDLFSAKNLPIIEDWRTSKDVTIHDVLRPHCLKMRQKKTEYGKSVFSAIKKLADSLNNEQPHIKSEDWDSVPSWIIESMPVASVTWAKLHTTAVVSVCDNDTANTWRGIIKRVREIVLMDTAHNIHEQAEDAPVAINQFRKQFERVCGNWLNTVIAVGLPDADNGRVRRQVEADKLSIVYDDVQQKYIITGTNSVFQKKIARLCVAMDTLKVSDKKRREYINKLVFEFYVKYNDKASAETWLKAIEKEVKIKKAK